MSLSSRFLPCQIPFFFLQKMDHIPFADEVVQAVFWPIAVCVYLSGSGVPVGPPEKHKYDASPVQLFAALLGIGLW